MKHLKLSLCLFVLHFSLAQADEVICRAECPEPLPPEETSVKTREFAFGSVVYHIGHVKVPRFMLTPQIGVEYLREKKESYETTKWFAGMNSVHGAMGGVAMAWGARFNDFSLGLLGGVYLQDVRGFHERGIDIMGVPIGSSMGLAPIVGIEPTYNFHTFRLHALLSPTMTVAYVSLPF